MCVSSYTNVLIPVLILILTGVHVPSYGSPQKTREVDKTQGEGTRHQRTNKGSNLRYRLVVLVRDRERELTQEEE